MREDKIKTLSENIVSWAKEQGKHSPYVSELEKLRIEDIGQAYAALAQFDEFVACAKNEILSLDNSSLKKLEHLLLHVPEERSFSRGQILMLNSIRSIVFIEQNNRRNDHQPPILEE